MWPESRARCPSCAAQQRHVLESPPSPRSSGRAACHPDRPHWRAARAPAAATGATRRRRPRRAARACLVQAFAAARCSPKPRAASRRGAPMAPAWPSVDHAVVHWGTTSPENRRMVHSVPRTAVTMTRRRVVRLAQDGVLGGLGRQKSDRAGRRPSAPGRRGQQQQEHRREDDQRCPSDRKSVV